MIELIQKWSNMIWEFGVIRTIIFSKCLMATANDHEENLRNAQEDRV